MQQTRHIRQRMSQRGVTMDMVNLVLEHGTPEHDRFVMGRREALELMEAMKREQRLLKKILDKGGVVVVAQGNSLITTYNCGHRHD